LGDDPYLESLKNVAIYSLGLMIAVLTFRKAKWAQKVLVEPIKGCNYDETFCLISLQIVECTLVMMAFIIVTLGYQIFVYLIGDWY